jgi:hypothetical protein
LPRLGTDELTGAVECLVFLQAACSIIKRDELFYKKTVAYEPGMAFAFFPMKRETSINNRYRE